jgi:hypothetical protein
MIGAELNLIAVLRHVCRHSHDTSIADQDVESLRFGSEDFSSFIDGGEGRQVTRDESELRLWGVGFNLIDDAGGTVRIAAAEVDVGRIVLCQLCNRGFSESSSSCIRLGIVIS